MHYCVYVIIKTKENLDWFHLSSSLKEALAPFSEHQENWIPSNYDLSWDWYMVGGRFSGILYGYDSDVEFRQLELMFPLPYDSIEPISCISNVRSIKNIDLDLLDMPYGLLLPNSQWILREIWTPKIPINYENSADQGDFIENYSFEFEVKEAFLKYRDHLVISVDLHN